MGFIIDTRPAQFHRELDRICMSGLFESKNIQHIHINDYKGGYMDWNAMYPIYQPGEGDVDFDMFFDYLKKAGYDDSLTLEATSMLSDGVNTEILNKSLNFIKNKLIY
jgi:sugar phosphate isomerase/epimerase